MTKKVSKSKENYTIPIITLLGFAISGILISHNIMPIQNPKNMPNWAKPAYMRWQKIGDYEVQARKYESGYVINVKYPFEGAVFYDRNNDGKIDEFALFKSNPASKTGYDFEKRLFEKDIGADVQKEFEKVKSKMIQYNGL